MYSPAQRIHKTCSDAADRNKHPETLKYDLVRCGYDETKVDRQLVNALKTPRRDLPQGNVKMRVDERVLLVVTDFHAAESLRRMLNDGTLHFNTGIFNFF